MWGKDTRIKISCPSQEQARKIVHEVNGRTNVHTIRAQMDKPQMDKPQVEKPQREKLQWERLQWERQVEKPKVEKPKGEKPKVEKPKVEKPTVEKLKENRPPTGNKPTCDGKTNGKTDSNAVGNDQHDRASSRSQKSAKSATDSPVPKLGAVNKLSRTVQKLREKSKKTIVELVCQNFPQGDALDDASVKKYLKTSLGSYQKISVANLVIESTAKTLNSTIIKIVFPSRTQAHRMEHEINRKTKDHRIRAKMVITVPKSKPLTENAKPKKENRQKKESLAQAQEETSYVGASSNPEAMLVRMRIESFRKMASISDAALRSHQVKLAEKERILQNLNAVRGAGLALHNEVESGIAHQQKLEELQNQKMEYENFWSDIITKIKAVEYHDGCKVEIDSYIDMLRLEVKKLKSALPIYACKSGIIDTIMKNDYLVLLGETGSGKSTQTPQYLAESDLSKNGIIACIQPRQVAAVSLACQVAKEMGTHVGGLVGYKAGYQTKMSPNTKVVYTTNHAMLKEIIKDPLLKEYSCLLVDEAHERSIYCDLLLGMIKEAKRQRPDLKVIVMSATIDPKLFVDYFNGCPIVKVSGRTFPVELVYKQYNDAGYDDNYMKEAIEVTKDVHRNEQRGDILVFLTSPAEIEKAVQETEQLRGVVSLPLHGRLQPDQQRKVFDPTPHGCRKIVFATNAAETSITIPGIKYVIDTGKAKEMKFDITRGISSLDVEWISKSSADQRKGRAGRIESGICYRLYTEETYNSMGAGSVPEILKSSTEMAFLTLMMMGIDDPMKFDFVEAPPQNVMDHAMKELFDLGAVFREGGLTDLGKKLAKLNMEPKYGKLLLQSVDQGFGFDGMVVTALLTVGSSIFFRMGSPAEKQLADKLKTRFCSPKGDVYTMFEVFKEWHDVPKKLKTGWCRENSINAKSMRMCNDFVNDLCTTLKKEMGISVTLKFSEDLDFKTKLDRLLLECYKKNVACFTGHSKVGYYVPHLELEIVLHPSSALHMLKEEPQWIVFTSVLETSRKYLLNPTMIDSSLIDDMQGSATADLVNYQMQLLNLNIQKVYSASVGQSVLSRFVGAKGQNIQRVEKEIKEQYLFEIPYALDVVVPSCNLSFYCSPAVADRAVTYVETELMKLKQELIDETIEDMLVPNTDVFCILEEGATVKTILMAEDYRTIMIRRSPPGISNQNVIDLFSKYGKIQRHFVWRQQNNDAHNKRTPSGWGKIMYEDEKDAKELMERYRKKADPELHHFMIEPEERRSFVAGGLSTDLSVSWTRRHCTGLGFLGLDDYQNVNHADIALRCTSTNGMEFKQSRKNPLDLVIHKVPKDATEELVREVIDEAIQIRNYNLKIIREKVPLHSEEEIELKHSELSRLIRAASLETNFHLHLVTPKELSYYWYGHIKTPNTEIAQKILDVCEKSITIDDVLVKFELKLSGQISLNQRLFQKMRRQYENLIAEAMAKFPPAKLCLEQHTHTRANYLKIVAPDAEAFTEIGKMCNELIFGTLVTVPSDFEVGIFTSPAGRKLVQSLEQQFKCVIEVDRRNHALRVYGNERICTQINERVDHFIENNRDRITRRIELIGDDKPNGVMKYLIKNYGVALQLFIAQTEVDSAEIILRQHALVINGTSEAITKAIEEVEKAAKELENAQDEAPAFTEECPICLCPITEKIYYLERCGHAYCYACVRAMFISAGRNKDLPITCAKDNCGEKIVMKDVRNLFNLRDDDYVALSDAALERFVLLNNKRIKYCLTPDCKMVYKSSGSKKSYQCPACFVKICRSCNTPDHEGVKCNISKILNSEEDRGIIDWLKDNKRDRCLCPQCNALIEKSAGCNHMTCHFCKSHFCWICKKLCPTPGLTYAHLSSTHGDIGI